MMSSRLTLVVAVFDHLRDAVLPAAPAPSSSAAWGGGQRGDLENGSLSRILETHSQHASSSWLEPQRDASQLACISTAPTG
jgi:hypothetical protein